MVFPGDAELDRKKIEEQIDVDRVTVVAVFADADDAERGLSDLYAAGFREDDVSVIARGTDAADEIPSQAAADEATSKAGVGAVVGAGAGGALGALLGVGAIAIPGIGPLVAAGWLATALAGAAIGAGAGAWVGTMMGLGVPEDVAKRYHEQVSRGRYLLMVRATEGESELAARRALDAAGAEDVASYPSQARPDRFPGSNPDVDAGPDQTDR